MPDLYNLTDSSFAIFGITKIGGADMAEKKSRRVYAGYYNRYDGKQIYVARVVTDIDTGEYYTILYHRKKLKLPMVEFLSFHRGQFLFGLLSIAYISKITNCGILTNATQ